MNRAWLVQVIAEARQMCLNLESSRGTPATAEEFADFLITAIEEGP